MLLTQQPQSYGLQTSGSSTIHPLVLVVTPNKLTATILHPKQEPLGKIEIQLIDWIIKWSCLDINTSLSTCSIKCPNQTTSLFINSGHNFPLLFIRSSTTQNVDTTTILHPKQEFLVNIEIQLIDWIFKWLCLDINTLLSKVCHLFGKMSQPDTS